MNMSEDVKENIQYEVKNVEYEKLVRELQDRLSNEDESELMQLWNDYCDIQKYYDNKVEPINWEEMAETFGVYNLIQQVIANQVSKNDKYYSIDGYGNMKMFSSITLEQSPMDLKEIAEKFIEKLEEKIDSDSDFEYEDECKYLIYEVKVNGESEKRILEVTDNSLLSFMEDKLTEIVGAEVSRNLVDDCFLMEVFDEIEQKMDVKVKVESNTNSNLASSHKKMKP